MSNNDMAAEDPVNHDDHAPQAEDESLTAEGGGDGDNQEDGGEAVATSTTLLAGSSMALVKLREQQAATEAMDDDQESLLLSEADEEAVGGVILHDPQMNEWLKSEKGGGTVEYVRETRPGMSSSKRALQYTENPNDTDENSCHQGRTRASRRPTVPGAVAVENQTESTAPFQEHDHEQGQHPQESEPQQHDNPQHPQQQEDQGNHVLLNATLVLDNSAQDEENGMLVVNAEEAPTGFKALLGNRYFLVLAIIVSILVVAVIVPLSVASSQNAPPPPPILPLEQTCGQRSILQADYRGSINVTETGLECQRWDQQSPHIHSWTKEDENYCRNPEQGSAQRPWCYTTDPKIRFQFCDVPYCDGGGFVDEPKTDCGSVELRQIDYRGTMNVTATGRTCQRWDSQTPHSHQNTPEIRPKAGLEDNNYCRNPSGFEPVAWCYTEDPEHPWEYCAVPVCTSDERTFVKPHNITSETFSVTKCGTENLRQADYRGNINTTISGRTCQRWDTQNQLRVTEELMERAGLEENYCRNWHGSDIDGAAFCYTEGTDDADSPSWEYCPVPFCPLETVGARKSCGSSSLLQTDYRGDISGTLFGFRCMDWRDSEDAAALGLTPEQLPLAGLLGPFCRNPDNRERAWCYVAGQPGVWQYCNVPVCQECGTDYLKKTDYRGTQSVTVNNRSCIPWVDAHGGFSLVVDAYGLESNYCRNPVGREEDVFCLVENNDTSWQIEFCDVPTCEE